MTVDTISTSLDKESTNIDIVIDRFRAILSKRIMPTPRSSPLCEEEADTFFDEPIQSEPIHVASSSKQSDLDVEERTLYGRIHGEGKIRRSPSHRRINQPINFLPHVFHILRHGVF